MTASASERARALALAATTHKLSIPLVHSHSVLFYYLYSTHISHFTCKLRRRNGAGARTHSHDFVDYVYSCIWSNKQASGTHASFAVDRRLAAMTRDYVNGWYGRTPTTRYIGCVSQLCVIAIAVVVVAAAAAHQATPPTC